MSPDPVLNKIRYSGNNSLTGDSILTTLAICGISVALPRFQASNMDVIEELREKFEHERKAYVNELRLFVEGCCQCVADGNYEDLYHYASIVTNNKIRHSANAIDIAVSKADKKLLRGVKKRSLDGISEIVPVMMDPTKTFSVELINGLLKILCGSWSSKQTLDDLKEANPLGSYLYSLEKM